MFSRGRSSRSGGGLPAALEEDDYGARVTGVDAIGRRDVVSLLVATGARLYNAFRCVDAFGELHVQVRKRLLLSPCCRVVRVCSCALVV